MWKVTKTAEDAAIFYVFGQEELAGMWKCLRTRKYPNDRGLISTRSALYL